MVNFLDVPSIPESPSGARRLTTVETALHQTDFYPPASRRSPPSNTSVVPTVARPADQLLLASRQFKFKDNRDFPSSENHRDVYIS